MNFGIFLPIDLCEIVFVTLDVTCLVELHGLSVAARIMMSVIFGLASFFANTFLNFKLV